MDPPLQATLTRDRCLLCDTLGRPLYHGLTDRLYGTPGAWSLWQCPNSDCGLVWQNPMIAPEHIAQAYRRYYTHQAPPSYQDSNAVNRMIAWVYGHASGRLPWMKDRHRIQWMYLDQAQPGRLLEVGCGSGERLAMFRDAGWQVVGQDVDPAAVTYARQHFGLEVQTSLDAWNRENPFDAVILNHVIEHVHDPIALMRRCHHLLTEDGVLVVVTPNALGFGHASFKADSFVLDQPRHLYLFSPRSIGLLAHLSGIDNIAVTTSSARSQGIGRITLDHMKAKAGSKSGNPHWLRDLWAMRYQWRAWRAWKRDPFCGDELVLIARR